MTARSYSCAVAGVALACSAALAQSPVPIAEVQAPPLLVVPGERNDPVLDAPSLSNHSPANHSPANHSPPVTSAVPDEGFTPSPEFQDWIANLVRAELPHQYEKKKNWGHTTKSFDGVSVQLDNGRLKTHRKYKQANDGKWQMYRVKLIDPEDKFNIRVENIRQQDNGPVQVEITVVASLGVFGRQTLWEHGVQLYSISAEADARVRLTATTDVATQLDPTRFPPDVYLLPEVKAARLEILDFKLRRISDLQGPLVRSLSHSVREALEEKLAEDNAKLVAKLNKSIDKQEPKLKFSAAELLASKWGGLLTGTNPEDPMPAE